MEEKIKHLLHPRRHGSVQISREDIQQPSRDWTTFQQWSLCFIVCNFNVDVGELFILFACLSLTTVDFWTIGIFIDPPFATFLFLTVFIAYFSTVAIFNTKAGPEIEILYPPDTHLSPSDLTAICFNSFPERQDSEIHDISSPGPSSRQGKRSVDLAFSFNIRNNSPDLKLHSPSPPYGSADTLYGSCLFRSEFDQMTKRSFNQKSLVLLSNHDFPAFHAKLLSVMTEFGAISDPSKLEAASAEIATWNPPTVGHQDLPFLGYLLQLEISFPLQGLSPPFIYAYEPTGSWDNLLQHMSSLAELYVAFERLFLCESIVVYAKSPQLCSDAVSCLADLIHPIPYAGARRPYLTMQSDFFAASQDKGLPRCFLIGITNPFLLKRITTAAKDSSQLLHIFHLRDSPGTVPLKSSKSQHSRRHKTEFDIPGGLEPQSPAKRYLKSDHDVLNTIDLTLKHPDPTVAPIGPFVRRHFADLAGQLLAPLSRFMTAEMSSTPLSPGGNPQYANFNQKQFLQSLSKYGTSVKFRGQTPLQSHRTRDSFYEQFVRSPNFYSWLDMKTTLDREAKAGMLNSV